MGDDVEVVSAQRTCQLDGKHVLLTGATGSLGKMVLAKLLLRHPSTIVYVLIRTMGRKSPEQRLKEEIINDSLFDGNRQHIAFENVIPVYGDILKKDIGVSIDDQENLQSKIEVIIHCESCD